MSTIVKMPGKETLHSIKFLDGLRGIAALYVMIGHARWLLWEGFENFSKHPEDYSIWGKLNVYFFSLFKYGHQMVLFFFILSGFVIHLKQSVALKNKLPATLKGYFWRRTRRILPPVLAALLLTYCCDLIVQYMDASIYHRTTAVSLLNENISFEHSPLTLAGNIAFLQGTYVPVYGSNGPLWSLKYEWWFYMLYPLLLFINKRNVTWSLVIVLLLSVMAMAGWSWGVRLLDDVLAYLICWWLGCISADIYTKRITLHYLVFPLASVCLLFIPFQSKLPFSSGAVKDVITAVGFFGLLNWLLYYSGKGIKYRIFEQWKGLGQISYSLYVIHFPLLVVANAIILRYTDNRMPQSMIFVWLSIPVIIGVSYLVYLIVEKPFLNPGSKKIIAVEAGRVN